MKLNIYHYITLFGLFICFFIIWHETLNHVNNNHKKINRIFNSNYFRLFIGCIYFVLLVVFAYETNDIKNQCQPHILTKYGIYI